MGMIFESIGIGGIRPNRAAGPCFAGSPQTASIGKPPNDPTSRANAGPERPGRKYRAAGGHSLVANKTGRRLHLEERAALQRECCSLDLELVAEDGCRAFSLEK